MSKYQISVLVPIYNSAKTLARALDSMIAQAIDVPIEIICINDGSTDRSPRILERYSNKFSEIKIITKKNTGYGDSMNRGLKKAKGKYIAILEPDDWIENGAFSTLLKIAEQNQAEVVRANYYREAKGIPKLVNCIKEKDTEQIFNPAELAQEKKKGPDFFSFPPAIWSAIYERQFLLDNDIKFLPTPGASYQDTGFNFKVLSTAKRVCLTHYAFLHYQVDNEASSVNDPGKVQCIVDEYQGIEEFLKEKKLERKLAHVMEAARFRNYHWNLQRLEEPRAEEFYPELVRSIKSANQKHHLRRDDFALRHWIVVRAILKDQGSAYRIIRFRNNLMKRIRH